MSTPVGWDLFRWLVRGFAWGETLDDAVCRLGQRAVFRLEGSDEGRDWRGVHVPAWPFEAMALDAKCAAHTAEILDSLG